jgi:DNA-binding response OmpR family regulator
MEIHEATILIVEDHVLTRRFLADNLAADGFEPIEAENAGSGRRLMAARSPNLAIIDLSLPDRDGLELLRDVRRPDDPLSRIDPDLPVLILSGRGAELDRIRGFECGADDYLRKPFSYGELRGRITALLRRASRRPRTGRLRIGPLELDPLAREALIDGTAIHLSKKEYALLRALAEEPTRVFTREELLRGVWGYQALGATRTLDSHASRLRRKLEPAGSFVINVWGVGYRLIDGPLGR